MGKHAQYVKRGGTKQQGKYAEPITGDFTLSTPLAATIRVSKVAAFPPGADGFRVFTRPVNFTGASNVGGVTGGPTYDQSGLGTGNTYAVSVQWYSGAVAVSPAGFMGNATTT